MSNLRRTTRILMLTAVLLLAGLACSLFNPRVETSLGDVGGDQTPAGQQPPAPGDVPNGPRSSLPFADSFDDAAGGWEVGDYDTGAVGYAAGEYFVTSNGDGNLMWGEAPVELADVMLQVQARQVSGPANDNTGYGVICRARSNPDGDLVAGYLLRISGDGFYAITKFRLNEAVTLVDWTPSDAIRLGNATNSIRAVCNGDRLVLFANGELLAETRDGEYQSGAIALAGTSFEAEPAEFRFDNLMASAP